MTPSAHHEVQADNAPEKNNKKTNGLWNDDTRKEDAAADAANAVAANLRLVRLSVCATGICLCYLAYGVLHEHFFRYNSDISDDNSNNEDTKQQQPRPGPSLVVWTQCVTNAIVALIWHQTSRSAASHSSPFGSHSSSSSSLSSSPTQSQSLPPHSSPPLPHAALFATALCYVAAMVCSNEAIPLVSYPVQVLIKSCKLLPIMLVGHVVSVVSSWDGGVWGNNNTNNNNSNTNNSQPQQSKPRKQSLYSRREWMAAALISMGIVLFQYTHHHYNSSSNSNNITNNTTNNNDSSGVVPAAADSNHDTDSTPPLSSRNLLHNTSHDGTNSHSQDSVSYLSPYTTGMLLLTASLILDGGLSVMQTVLKRAVRPPTATETMFYTNLYAAAVLLPLCGVTGQLTPMVALVRNHHQQLFDANQFTLFGWLTTVWEIATTNTFLLRLALLNTTVALGQIFIFLTLTWFSPVTTTLITTTRKFLTILLSVWFYGHAFGGVQWIAVALVFGGLYMAILATVWDDTKKEPAAATDTDTSDKLKVA